MIDEDNDDSEIANNKIDNVIDNEIVDLLAAKKNKIEKDTNEIDI